MCKTFIVTSHRRRDTIPCCSCLNERTYSTVKVCLVNASFMLIFMLLDNTSLVVTFSFTQTYNILFLYCYSWFDGHITMCFKFFEIQRLLSVRYETFGHYWGRWRVVLYCLEVMLLLIPEYMR